MTAVAAGMSDLLAQAMSAAAPSLVQTVRDEAARCGWEVAADDGAARTVHVRLPNGSEVFVWGTVGRYEARTGHAGIAGLPFEVADADEVLRLLRGMASLP